jgi:hypothetical protein
MPKFVKKPKGPQYPYIEVQVPESYCIDKTGGERKEGFVIDAVRRIPCKLVEGNDNDYYLAYLDSLVNNKGWKILGIGNFPSSPSYNRVKAKVRNHGGSIDGEAPVVAEKPAKKRVDRVDE